MDRDQQSRKQKAGAAPRAASRPKNRPPQRPRQQPPKRSLGSRIGLEKRTDAHTHPPRSQPAHTAHDLPPRPARSQPTPAASNPQSAGYRPGAPRHQRRVTQVEKLRIRRRRKLVGVVCVVGALLLGVVLSVNLLFKVTDFRIENTDRTTPANTGIYTEQQILDLLGVQVGDNLFGFSTKKKTQQLQQQLPYLDVVQVDIQMPGTVVVKVQPATERFTLETSAGWLVLSDGLKVLRSDSAQPDGLILLQARPDPACSQAPGSYLTFVDAAAPATAETATAETAGGETGASRTDAALARLLEALEEYGLLDGVTLLSLEDLEEISFLYQGRVSVALGTANNLDYKLRLASRIVLDTDGTGLSNTDKGTLDVSYQRSDGDIVAYFAPAQPTPEPTPVPDADSDGEPAGGDAADGDA